MLVKDIAGLYIPQLDHVTISPAATPASGDQTMTYRMGGASGRIVATVTLTFDADRNLTTIARG